MRACSYGGRENPDEATSCSECLTPLAAAPNAEGNLPPNLDELQQEQEAGKKMRTTGAVWVLGGIAATFVSYLEAVSSPYAQHNIQVLTAGQSSGKACPDGLRDQRPSFK
jgi:hypothetical protein